MKTWVPEFNKDLFLALTESNKKKLETESVKEEEVLKDFEKFRKSILKGKGRF